MVFGSEKGVLKPDLMECGRKGVAAKCEFRQGQLDFGDAGAFDWFERRGKRGVSAESALHNQPNLLSLVRGVFAG